MDQLTRWQKIVDDLNDTTLSETDKAIFNYYQGALKDIKKQAQVYIKQYETLTFAQRLEADRLLGVGEKIKTILDETNKQVTDAVKNGTAEQVTNGYYGTLYGLEGAENVNLPMSILDKSYIEQVVNQPVDGKTLSKRLYSNTQRLAKTTTQSILQGAIDGKGYAYVAKRIADQTEADYKRALRIARTEGGRASSQATQRAYDEAKDAGVSMEKMWVSTLDKKTRHSHQDLDGQKVGVDEDFVSPKTGATGQGPRLMGRASEDINCRCTTIAVVNGIVPALRRDNETGEIIQSMTYKEWQQSKGVPDDPPKKTPTVKPEPDKAKMSLQERSDIWWEKLTDDEKSALRHYSSGDGMDVLNYHRGREYFKNIDMGDPYNVNYVKDLDVLTKDMDNAIDKFGILDDTEVFYRGVDFSYVEEEFGVNNDDIFEVDTLKRKMIGKTITEKAYTSTTKLRDEAYSMGNEYSLIEIEVPKGSKGAYIGKHSLIDDQEEFLLPRNTKLEFTDVYFDDERRLVFKAKAVTSGSETVAETIDDVVETVRYKSTSEAFKSVKYTGIEKSYAKSIDDRLLDLQNTYPISQGQIEITARANKGAFGYNSTNIVGRKINGRQYAEFNQNINFSNTLMSTYEDSISRHKYTYQARGSKLIDDVMGLSTVDHEYAHAIDNVYTLMVRDDLAKIAEKYATPQLITMADVSEINKFNRELNTAKERLSEVVYDRLKQKVGVSNVEFIAKVRAELGSYAIESRAEFLAEGFSNARNLSNPSQFIKDFKEIFDEEYNTVIGGALNATR